MPNHITYMIKYKFFIITLIFSILFTSCQSKQIGTLENDKSCSQDADCKSGYCDKICKDNDNDKGEIGDWCFFDSDCKSDHCGLFCEPKEEINKLSENPGILELFQYFISLLYIPVYIILYIFKIMLMIVLMPLMVILKLFT